MSLEAVYHVITVAAVAYLLSVLTYAGFLAYCTALKLRETGRIKDMPVLARGHVYAIVYFFLPLDVFINVTIGSLIFLRPPHPKRLLFTARLKAWRNDTGYRGKFARWFCEGWLNPGDPGHC